MAKTIKVIDLLNKIANGEEVPEKIKYDNTIWQHNKTKTDYQDTGSTRLYFFAEFVVYNSNWLNDTVEIIEEKQDIDIQELEEIENWYVDEKEECREFDIQAINLCFKKHQEKINELVQAVKQLDKKYKR